MDDDSNAGFLCPFSRINALKARLDFGTYFITGTFHYFTFSKPG